MCLSFLRVCRCCCYVESCVPLSLRCPPQLLPLFVALLLFVARCCSDQPWKQGGDLCCGCCPCLLSLRPVKRRLAACCGGARPEIAAMKAFPFSVASVDNEAEPAAPGRREAMPLQYAAADEKRRKRAAAREQHRQRRKWERYHGDGKNPIALSKCKSRKMQKRLPAAPPRDRAEETATAASMPSRSPRACNAASSGLTPAADHPHSNTSEDAARAS